MTRDTVLKLRAQLEALEDPAPLQLLQAAIENLWLARHGTRERWCEAAIDAHLDLADHHWRNLDAYLARHQPTRQTLLDVLEMGLARTQSQGGAN